MPFATEDAARRFLIDSISARAIAEGCPLSDDELRMLVLPGASPALGSDGGRRRDAEDGVDFVYRMAALLRHAYELDSFSAGGQGQLYRDAVAALPHGDDEFRGIAGLAGLAPPLPAWWTAAIAMAGFAFLVLPALAAFLIAAAGVWGARSRATESPGQASGMFVLALILAAFGVYLLSLWLKARRGPDVPPRLESRPGKPERP